MKVTFKALAALALAVFITAPAQAQIERLHVADAQPQITVIHAPASTAPGTAPWFLNETATTLPPNTVRVVVTPRTCAYTACQRVLETHNSRVDAGANLVANNISGTQASPAKYVAFSADTTAVAKGDTTCPSEIASGGLSRGAGTFGNYTAPATLGGTASYTITASFTATAAYTINKLCMFNAASAGTMLFETILGSTVSGGNGDTLNVSWTVNV